MSILVHLYTNRRPRSLFVMAAGLWRRSLLPAGAAAQAAHRGAALDYRQQPVTGGVAD